MYDYQKEQALDAEAPPELVALSHKTALDLDFQDGCLVIIPSGDLDLDSAEDFRAQAISVLESICGKYRIDMAKVKDIDAVNLGILLNLGRMLSEEGENRLLEIVNTNDDLARLFDLIKISKFCKVAGI